MKPSLLKIHGHFYLLQLLVRITYKIGSIHFPSSAQFFPTQQARKEQQNNVKVPVKMLASEDYPLIQNKLCSSLKSKKN